MSLSSWRRRALAAVAVVSVLTTQVLTAGAATTRSIAPHVPLSTGCQWIAQSRTHRLAPAALAREVLRRMTLHEKANMVVLAMRPMLENLSDGVPGLCIPELWISDGPVGLGDGLTRVTQFPAPITVAASFNPSVARSIGVALAQEASAKGINVVQGTELNLARVPQSGRIFETYGEDPWLTSVLGVANIEGTQSQGVMAMAKHFGAYTQETARLKLNQVVDWRSLMELYLAPFRAAVEQAHVASLMCAYGAINGVNSCSDPRLYAVLRSWGFAGFVRSDFHAVQGAGLAAAFRAGVSLVKPARVVAIVHLVNSGAISRRDLNRAVLAVLTEMFRFNLVGSARGGSLSARATNVAHWSVALHAAEAGVVLLKNVAGVLPLSTHVTSIAVIGTDASRLPIIAGGGSSAVLAHYLVTPLVALRHDLGPHVHISYSLGGPANLDVDSLGGVSIVSGVPLKLITPYRPPGRLGKSDLIVDSAANITPAVATATRPGRGEGWSSWRMKVRATTTGTFLVSVQQNGDAWFFLNHRPLLSSAGIHPGDDMATTVRLVQGRTYVFDAHWFSLSGVAAPKFGVVDVTPMINRAVAAARHARVAVVFVGAANSESLDRANLSLPGDANALIRAVAAVNPRTIVVLNTGGAVVMPWLHRVAGVLEAWYPGQVDGSAVAAVLTGAVDPSGRLPITFPTSEALTSVHSASAYPGINSQVHFNAGLDIGYRWYQVHHVAPLFPFGFGLAYTTFHLTSGSVSRLSSGVRVSVVVRNVGQRRGTDVIEAYVGYPGAAHEPPLQLRGFSQISLAPSSVGRTSMVIPWRAFKAYLRGSFTTVPGQYTIALGESSAALAFRLHVQLGH